MKTLLILAALLAGVTAQAARPNTQNMTAAQARALVEKSGSIVLSTSSFGYDRFVANQYLCGSSKAVAAYVPTLDSDAAFIGYSCGTYSSDDMPSSKKYARNAYICPEGKTRTTQESRGGGEATVAVSRICSNGKWQRMGVDPVGPKRVACTDGSYRTQKVSRGSEIVEQTKVCRDGKWYSVN
jgi:hypothetical protein